VVQIPRRPSVFKDRVLAVVLKIPKGETLTYGEVANLAGYPGAARAVGSVMSSNFRSDIPCHRVVRADGIGRYNRGEEKKKELLKKEGAI
jgi:methylated-DNA-[protein]-cysteine S-methyltransferase